MNCLNGEKYLEEALQSIKNQSYSNWELIFWDNNSIDNSKNIFMKNFDKRMIYFKSNHTEPFGTVRNKAMSKANGELVAFLDTDDIWLPDKLNLQIKYFEKSSVGMVISNTLLFSEFRNKALFNKNPPTGNVYKNLILNYFISQETLIFRKSILINLEKNNFDIKYNAIVDFDLNIRLSKLCLLEYCPFILSKYRIHDNNFTNKNKYLFVKETEIWIKDNKKLIKSKKEKSIFNILEDSNNSNYSRLLMTDNLRFNALKKILKCNFFKFKNLITLFLIFLPFTNKFFTYYYKKQNRLK